MIALAVETCASPQGSGSELFSEKLLLVSAFAPRCKG